MIQGGALHVIAALIAYAGLHVFRHGWELTGIACFLAAIGIVGEVAKRDN